MKIRLKNAPRRNLYLIPASCFFGGMTFYYPVAVLAYAQIAGSFTAAMSVFSIYSLSQFLMELPTGILSDKMGRKKTIIAGSICEVLATILYVAAFDSPHGLYILLAGAFLNGTSGAFFSGNNEAMLHDSLTYYRQEKYFAHLIGRQQSMEQLALAFTGLAAAFVLWLGYGYKMLFILTLAPVIASLLCAWLTIEPIKKTESEPLPSLHHFVKSLKLIVQNKTLLLLTIATVWRKGWGESSNNLMPAFIGSLWSEKNVPLYRTMQSMMGFVTFWFSGKIVMHLGYARALIWSEKISMIVGCTAYSLNNMISPFLMILTQVTYAMRITATSSLQQSHFSQEQRATMGSVISFLESVFKAFCLLVLGFLTDIFSPTHALLFTLMLTIPVHLVYKKIYRDDMIHEK